MSSFLITPSSTWRWKCQMCIEQSFTTLRSQHHELWNNKAFIVFLQCCIMHGYQQQNSENGRMPKYHIFLQNLLHKPRQTMTVTRPNPKNLIINNSLFFLNEFPFKNIGGITVTYFGTLSNQSIDKMLELSLSSVWIFAINSTTNNIACSWRVRPLHEGYSYPGSCLS